MYQAEFKIVKENDRKYDLLSFSVLAIATIAIMLVIYTDILDGYELGLLIFICIGNVTIFISRFFLKSYDELGLIRIADDEIQIETNTLSIEINQAEKIHFQFNGCFADSTSNQFFSFNNPGTRNILSVTAKQETYELNIFLLDDKEKEKLHKILDRYTKYTGTPISFDGNWFF